ncbi:MULTISPECIES: SDR family oxidoreductase [unclassified Leptospira]|uniref:SDR family oxidoreductase n=1 Tax=unclassified Leptospira TaxID=2633828 RepID=UPI0002BE6537|nr:MULTISPECIES: SDR family oxidoreductase [unclassified Leptospira]EMJ97525.1 KR domain protein [Leptospira sp. B5-022]MCR1793197.1 SDR family oxidoreductase [Leptospira sp. id769339]
MDKKIAIVTGASRGIGKEVSKQLAKSGIHIVCASRKKEDSEKTVVSIRQEGGSAESFALDVSDPNSIRTFLNDVLSKYPKIDILVNNAGVYLDSGSIENTTLEMLQGTLDTNLIGPFLLSQKIFGVMKKNDYGRIVNVSSGMGQLYDMSSGYAAYRISKAALNALTRILHSESSGKDIKVNSVCPGWVRTDMGGKSATRSVEHGAETIVWAAQLDKSGPSGVFLRDKKEIPW